VEGGAGRRFSVRRAVRWGDADPAGLIYGPRCFDYAVEAVEAFWEAVLGLGFLDLHRAHRMGAPWVHASCDYLRPLAPGDEVEVTLAVERLGASSITYRIEGAGPDGQAAFRVTLVSAMVDLDTGKPTPVPEAMRERVRPYLVGA
jgi:4-hydroxybenzoyl-CoA thioesterase